MLALALVVLVVEGYFVYRWYDRYYRSDTVPEAASASASAFAGTMPEGMTSEGTMPEGTVPEETAPEEADAVGDVPSKTNDAETAFTHIATDENSRGDYTYLSDPAIDGDPDAVVLVVSSEDAGSAGYGRNVGVWYDFVDRRRWAIFNQDRAAVPAGSTFRVVVPPASESFVHRAEPVNTVGNITYLNDPLTDGRPGAVVSVTQNWNPGGGVGVYNDHPVGVLYDEDVQKWAVYNLDGAPMPEGVAFNLAVSGDGQGTR